MALLGLPELADGTKQFKDSLEMCSGSVREFDWLIFVKVGSAATMALQFFKSFQTFICIQFNLRVAKG